MKAMAICGSRHAGGSTERLLKRCLDRLAKKGIPGALLLMQWKKVFPCLRCGDCEVGRHGGCSIEGDDFQTLFKAMREADILIIGAPVDPGAAPSDLKHLLERAARVSRAGGSVFKRKLGAPVALMAKEASGHTLQRLLAWFPGQGFVVPGAASFPLSKGAVSVTVRDDEAGEAVMDELADNLAWLAVKLADPESKGAAPIGIQA
jgi:multimeric flavodoxin WrbA